MVGKMTAIIAANADARCRALLSFVGDNVGKMSAIIAAIAGSSRFIACQ